MERDYNDEDFDYFLKQKADQYKLYPSDKVWKGVYSHLHPKTRWFTIGGGLLLITGLFFVSQHFISPGTTTKPTADLTFIPASHPGTILDLNPAADSKNVKAQASDGNTDVTENAPVHKPAGIAVKAVNGTSLNGIIAGGNSKSVERVTRKALMPAIVKADRKTGPSINTALPLNDIGDMTVPESTTEKEWTAPELAAITVPPTGNRRNNWLQELAAIKLTARKKNLFDIQFYFSPTITYRRLSDNKNAFGVNQQNIPLTNNSLNIDRYVDHKPSFGAELGSNLLFNVSRNLVVKTGVQLNYSRYNIKAYKFYFEKASIALNTSGPIADTIRAFTSIRNFNGYSPEELQNQYLQVSLPIGAELKLLGNNRLQLNIAGTIQPTYLLFNDTYLLSTDYVNYAKEASLVRKWNVNTSLEAFLAYRTGGLRWQIGPQFRYQLKSSYIDRYPIKEYLMEYGVKIGVSKTLR